MLYHFSEEPNIEVFEPRKHPSHPDMDPMVWAIDGDRAPIYFLPRDCPRICYWPVASSSQEDLKNYYSETKAAKVIVVESDWYRTVQDTQLFVYHLPEDSFYKMDDGAGYYISHETIIPNKVEPMGDLIQRLLEADVELRFTPNLKTLSEKLPLTTLHFSMIRLRNANM